MRLLAIGEALQLGFELRQRVPVARDQQQHGELGAQVRHPALADIAAALADQPGQFVDHPGAVAADR